MVLRLTFQGGTPQCPDSRRWVYVSLKQFLSFLLFEIDPKNSEGYDEPVVLVTQRRSFPKYVESSDRTEVP